jgi:uracil-DNA glycosylase family 4
MTLREILRTVAEQVSDCQRCSLHHTRKKSVPGEGPASAQVMLIGEGPGFFENEQGRPFVGPAGKFLDELLQNAGLKRQDVFIGNVVKCRPPGNRDPEPEELAACGEYLQQQIDAINPRVIITLGRYSMGRFFPNAKISAVHGQAKMDRRAPDCRHVPSGSGTAPAFAKINAPGRFQQPAEVNGAGCENNPTCGTDTAASARFQCSRTTLALRCSCRA